MSLIKNLVKENEKPISSGQGLPNESNTLDAGEKTIRPFIKSATDLQRLKIEKLMKNPDKPVIIPEPRHEKDYLSSVPTFVRNVMGSSAGAGSGEFHVYRHLRRKEYARQKNIQAKSAKEEADEAFKLKLEENKRIADCKTAKRRAKRLKKKERTKRQRPLLQNEASHSSNSESEKECARY